MGVGGRWGGENQVTAPPPLAQVKNGIKRLKRKFVITISSCLRKNWPTPQVGGKNLLAPTCVGMAGRTCRHEKGTNFDEMCMNIVLLETTPNSYFLFAYSR
jgi:hypothetical protein